MGTLQQLQSLWIGPRGGELWMPAPQAGLAFTPIGWTSGDPTTYINGGAGGRRSQDAHMDYPMQWSLMGRTTLSPLRDMYNGSRGDGLIYFIDPSAADLNVLPSRWAFPGAACKDSVPIIGSERPGVATTPSNPYNHPPISAQYVLNSTDISRQIYVPIPPGFDAWFGATGSQTGTGGVRVTPVVSGSTVAAAIYPTLLDVNSGTRVNTQVSGEDYTGVLVDIDPTGSAASTTLTSMCMQILSYNSTPDAGGFIGGWGHSGCDFDGFPTVNISSSALDQASATAHFVEQGDWQ